MRASASSESAERRTRSARKVDNLRSSASGRGPGRGTISSPRGAAPPARGATRDGGRASNVRENASAASESAISSTPSAIGKRVCVRAPRRASQPPIAGRHPRPAVEAEGGRHSCPGHSKSPPLPNPLPAAVLRRPPSRRIALDTRRSENGIEAVHARGRGGAPRRRRSAGLRRGATPSAARRTFGRYRTKCVVGVPPVEGAPNLRPARIAPPRCRRGWRRGSCCRRTKVDHGRAPSG